MDETEEIDPEVYYGLEEGRKGKRSGKSLPALARKERGRLHRLERAARREAEAVGAKAEIASYLSSKRFPGTEEGKRQLQLYTQWVKESLEQKFPVVNEPDVRQVELVRKNNRGRKETVTNLVHLPTLMAVRDGQGEEIGLGGTTAFGELFDRLGQHFEVWRTLEKNSTNGMEPEAVIEEILERQKEERDGGKE